MNEFEEIEKVKNFIIANKKPAYFTTNKKELRVRCPYCGDSRKDPTHAHLYIQMKPPFKFYCQKCNTGGVLNSKTMRDFQLYDTEIAVSLSQMSKHLTETRGYSSTSFRKREYKMEAVDSKQSFDCCQYFNSRFNTNFSNQYIVERFKAVTDIDSFVINNSLNLNFVQYDLRNSIGFMSADNSHIVFRDISGFQPRRYFNLSLVPDDDFEINKFYALKTSVDILQPEINLVLTEGIFDIIGVFNHFYGENTENTIFAAACGKGYNSVISNFIHKGFLNMNITIYSDADVNVDFYRNLKLQSPYLKKTPIIIFYNTKEKDFGIPKDRISLRKIII